jgi:hypothetical protein
LRGKGVTGFPVLLCAVTAAFGALLWLVEARRARPVGIARRLLEVAGIAVACGVPAALLARSGVATDVSALAASNSWYRSILEFSTFFGGLVSWQDEVKELLSLFGLTLLAAPVALVVQLRSLPRDGRRPAAAFLVWWGLMFLALAATRRRFAPYLAVPLAIWCGDLLVRIEAAVRRRPESWRRLAILTPALGVLLLVSPQAGDMFRAPPPVSGLPEMLPALTWLRAQPLQPGREAVLSSWTDGHLIRYYARRPVLTSPFGVDGGAGAMEDAARILYAGDERAAQEVLDRRRIGFILLRESYRELAALADFAPAEAPRPVRIRLDRSAGVGFQVDLAFAQTFSARLYNLDGAEEPSWPVPALSRFRLLYEAGPPPRPGFLDGPTKLYQNVPGVRLRVTGARPGAPVIARVVARANSGRTFTWWAAGVADAGGGASLVEPYATGWNGFLWAEPVIVESEGRRTSVEVDDAAVTGGLERLAALPRTGTEARSRAAP